MGEATALSFFAFSLTLSFYLWLRNFARLDAWLDSPSVQTVPEGSGMWEEIFPRLKRIFRQSGEDLKYLEATLKDLQQATAAIPDGVVILDDSGRIEWFNPMAEKFFTLDAQRDIGQQITYLVRQPQFAEYLDSPILQSDPLILKLSHDRILSMQLIPYGERKKLLVSRDTTRLENVEKMRRDFVANVSHELRTPLTVVGGFLETLSDMEKPDPEMTRRSLDLMQTQTERMKRLVEDLLTLSQLENAENPLREENVNVTEMLNLIYQEALSLSGKTHKIELVIETDAGLFGNPDELRSAFGNLVSNAIRYTPGGGEIDLVWKMEEGGAVFSVKDSGIGIGAEHIPRLTERFYRVDRSRSRGTGGTGLGLAIVKHVLNRHQAKLEISSQPGKGSVFCAIFPSFRIKTV